MTSIPYIITHDLSLPSHSYFHYTHVKGKMEEMLHQRQLQSIKNCTNSEKRVNSNNSL
jgi:hypothetical protein